MVTKWGMGRDPEATEGGISGRGSLSFFVPTAGHTLPSEIQAASSRAIRAILDEAYAEASQTLIAHLETLRRLAAYLVEHERVDGATFDELFDGRMAVPTAADEWRAATSRPRAWGDVVDLAGHRTRSAARPAAVAVSATSTPEAPSATTPSIGEPNAPSIPANETPMVEALQAVRARGQRDRRSAGRRVRSVAASWLRRAERWIGSSELEADRL
jgi:hypothetical protein